MATSLEIARDLRHQAIMLNRAADILDPPKGRRRRRTKAQMQAETNGTKEVRKQAAAVKLDLGTRGRTSHPNDPDAKALAESLAWTTEGPA